MEPMNCTVHVRKDGCDIWVGIQVVSRAQATAAQVTGLPPEKVQVHNHLIGGGFGRRLDVDGITQAVTIAKQVEGPVKIVWSREDDIHFDYFHSPAGMFSCARHSPFCSRPPPCSAAWPPRSNCSSPRASCRASAARCSPRAPWPSSRRRSRVRTGRGRSAPGPDFPASPPPSGRWSVACWCRRGPGGSRTTAESVLANQVVGTQVGTDVAAGAG